MHHIVYWSRATRTMTPMELVALLIGARMYNESMGITGALVYDGTQFMQVIEGEEAVIQDLYGRIIRDSRHRDAFKLADKAIAERTFVNWSMAFRELSPGEFADITGYTSPEQWQQLDFGSASVDTLLLERMRGVLIGEKG